MVSSNSATEVAVDISSQTNNTKDTFNLVLRFNWGIEINELKYTHTLFRSNKYDDPTKEVA